MVHETQTEAPVSPSPNATFTSVDAAYVIITNGLSVMSIVGNLVIIGCYYLYNDIRTTGRKLFVSLSIANFIMCVGALLQAATFYKSTERVPQERSVLCETAALFTVYSNTATCLWTDAIGFYLFLCVTLRFIVVANRVTWLFHIFSWVMPAVVAFSAGASDVYGYDDTFLRKHRRPAPCWISDRVSNKMDWYFVTIEGWMLASYLASILLYTVISCSVKCQAVKKIDRNYVIEDMAIQTANKQLRYIPLIFICLRIWGTFYFLFVQYGPAKGRDMFGDSLLIMKAIGDNSIGLANCLLFLLSIKAMRKRIARWFSDRCKGKVSVPEKWRPSTIVRRIQKKKPQGLDLSGISLDFPTNDDSSSIIDDDILFEREV
ncbi:G-protein coupled receptor 157-like [Haliotis rufescens]|uniref:G-protein coupled receptor 157-like n=1 Tax=Haliotis rufescens TaxID=6454 RepID=UPI001EAFBF83|nr:G-protein coupled receptor 157-like [Haliotis rufescens]XP_046329295.1 G-protein coupled receptor 157-like [Haliotis rufescens]XP_046329296.1 G-protein coupled receptor 157-like [Haliotis rufescens]